MTVRVAVLGLGKKGFSVDFDSLRKKPESHAGAYLACPRTELVAAYDPSEEARRRFAEAYPQVRVYDDVERLLYEAKAEIVSIAAPVEAHNMLVSLASRYHPVKVIMVEKPIAQTLEEAEHMIAMCRFHGVKLAVNHSRRWDPIWQMAQAEAMRHYPPFKMLGICSGDKLEAGIHMADLFNWFGSKTGKSEEVWGDPQYVSLITMGQRPYEPYLVFELDVFHGEGRIRVVDNGRTLIAYKAVPSQRYSGLKELERCETVVKEGAIQETVMILGSNDPKTRQVTPMLLAIENLVEAVEKGAPILCTGENGLEALKTCKRWL